MSGFYDKLIVLFQHYRDIKYYFMREVCAFIYDLLSHFDVINNYLLNGNKVQLYFIEMNSRFFISGKSDEELAREIIFREFIEVK